MPGVRGARVETTVDELMNGRYVLFWVGFVFPLLWIIGALLVPTVRVLTRRRRVSAPAH